MGRNYILISIFLFIFITPAVNAAPPVANLTADVTFGSAPFDVSFTDLSLNRPLGWAWFFGDEEYMETWTMVNANAGWSARKGHNSVVMPDGSIILMGGRVAGSGYMNDVWRSSDNGASWTQMTASAEWSPRDAFGSIVMPDGSIVLMGGLDSSIAQNDVWRSSDNGASWTQMTASAEWSPRDAFGSVVMPDGSIVLMGGSSLDWQNNDVWRSSDDGATWTQMTTDAVWEARQFPSSVVMPDGSIILMGGWAGRNAMNDVWRSRDSGATWTQLTINAEWSARDRHSSVVMPDGSIILMGGDEGSNNKNDVWRLMPVGSSIQNPTHTYSLPGTYQVALQAYNTDGYNSTRMTGYITVITDNNPVVTGDDNSILNHVKKFIRNILLRK